MARTFVLVASNPYSGSTLLASLLGSHPDVTTVGGISSARRERDIHAFLCSCGRPMLECPFWREIRARMRAGGYPDFELENFGLGFDYGDASLISRLRSGSLRWAWLESARDALLRLWPAHEARLSAIGRRNADFARNVLELTGASVLLDTSKERMRARYLFDRLPMDGRAIHLVRDPRGVVDSSLRRGRNRGDARRAAIAWSRTNAAIERAIRRLPADRHTMVRYEDLCRDPSGTLDGLYRFIGVSPRPSATDAWPEHLLGNSMRLRGRTEIALDERWRVSLGQDQLRQINGAIGPAGRRLYPMPLPRVAPGGVEG